MSRTPPVVLNAGESVYPPVVVALFFTCIWPTAPPGTKLPPPGVSGLPFTVMVPVNAGESNGAAKFNPAAGKAQPSWKCPGPRRLGFGSGHGSFASAELATTTTSNRANTHFMLHHKQHLRFACRCTSR